MKLKSNHPYLSNRKEKEYKATVKLDPMPGNCYDCPFFYRVDDEEGYYEHWNCFLEWHYDSFGVALGRHRNCPLEKEG